MIRIGHPFVENRNSESFLISHIDDECRGESFDVWYSVSNEYGSYLCEDYADSFVLVALLWAMKSGQEIVVDAPVSPRLQFSLYNTVQPIYAKAIPGFRPVKISSQPNPGIKYNGKGLGCCCSLGIDSFSSFLQHYGPEVPQEYRVSHLTLFNSGQLGDETWEKVHHYFVEAADNLRPFAAEVGLPLLAVDTNLNDFFLGTGVTGIQSVLLRTISCALSLQKLFGKYAFASSYSIEYFKLCAHDDAYAEAAVAPLLSTDNTEIILSDPAKTRVEKTAFISKYPITTKYLDVCWSAQMAKSTIHQTKFFDEKKNKNCGKCDKCLRTLLALDLLGCLPQYEHLFDMDYYRKNRNHYIAKLLAHKDENASFADLLNLMESKGIRPTLATRILSLKKRSAFLTRLGSKLRKIR